MATATVGELCRLAAERYGLRTLRAATSHGNIASRKVLTKAGFVPVGPADPAEAIDTHADSHCDPLLNLIVNKAQSPRPYRGG